MIVEDVLRYAVSRRRVEQVILNVPWRHAMDAADALKADGWRVVERGLPSIGFGGIRYCRFVAERTVGG